VRIGVDFDNTIACYDGVFHVAAIERGLIPAQGVAADKTSVRDYLRGLNRDGDFTELQGWVYGPGMKLVRPYPGLAAALKALHAAGCELAMVSHKTPAPFAGPAYDLHQSAQAFLAVHGLVGEGAGQFAADKVFFEFTKEDKIARVAALDCDVFIDDLPEILALDGFPTGIRKILFDPEGLYPGGYWEGHLFEAFADWEAIVRAILGPAT
jgi:hypothetical protein